VRCQCITPHAYPPGPRKVSISLQLSDALFIWNWIGFGIAVVGGSLLFSVSAETYLTNIAFLTKLGLLIPLGLVLHIAIQRKAPVWENALETPPVARQVDSSVEVQGERDEQRAGSIPQDLHADAHQQEGCKLHDHRHPSRPEHSSQAV